MFISSDVLSLVRLIPCVCIVWSLLVFLVSVGMGEVSSDSPLSLVFWLVLVGVSSDDTVVSSEDVSSIVGWFLVSSDEYLSLELL